MQLAFGSLIVLSLSAFSPEKQRFRVPILMYHYIQSLPPPRDRMGRGLTVTPKTFARQLDTLTEKGYQTIDFATLARSGATLPKKPILLTFDDGYDDAYSQALPVLLAHHMHATFYIVTGFVGTPHYVTWAELKTMRDAGMDIAAHTVHHDDLRKLPAEKQAKEILGSIKTLQENLSVRVQSFAYPSGRHTNAAVRTLRSEGIPFAVTTRPGIASDRMNPLLLPRVRMKETTNLSIMF